MKGVIEKDNLEELKQCMNDADELAVMIEEIQEDLRSKDLFKMFEGIKLLGEVITMVPEKLRECEEIRSDVKKFEEWGMIFTKPKELSERLLRNMPEHFKEILQLIEDANQEIKKGDYFKYGEDIGEALVLAVGTVEDISDESDEPEDFEAWYEQAMKEWEEWAAYTLEDDDSEEKVDLDFFN